MSTYSNEGKDKSILFKNLLSTEKREINKHVATPNWICSDGHRFFSAYDSREHNVVTCPKCNKEVTNPYFNKDSK